MTDYKIMPYFVLNPLSVLPQAAYIIWSFLKFLLLCQKHVYSTLKKPVDRGVI